MKYNEWMNPIDYELEDAPVSKDSSSGGRRLIMEIYLLQASKPPACLSVY